jgi:hypothetical protein
VIILLLIVYWLYKRYKNKKEKKRLESLIELIKNHITITLYNIQQFIIIPDNMKKILLKYAQEYKHDDIIKILS